MGISPPRESSVNIVEGPVLRALNWIFLNGRNGTNPPFTIASGPLVEMGKVKFPNSCHSLKKTA
jgi:hypothetical protein